MTGVQTCALPISVQTNLVLPLPGQEQAAAIFAAVAGDLEVTELLEPDGWQLVKVLEGRHVRLVRRDGRVVWMAQNRSAGLANGPRGAVFLGGDRVFVPHDDLKPEVY